MRGSAVHVRLRYWSILGLSIAVAVALGPTAALADTGSLSEESQATEQVADTAGTATEQVADSAGTAAEQVADTGTATEQVADTAGTATEQVADTAGTATEQVADTAGTATDQVADTAGTATEQVADTLGQTAAQATDTVAQRAEHVTDTAWRIAPSAGSDPLPVISESRMAFQSATDAAGIGIGFTDASSALTVAPSEELASEYQGVLLWDEVVTAVREAGDPLPVISESGMAFQSATDAAGIGFTDASSALTVAPSEELASYQGVLLPDAVDTAAREAGGSDPLPVTSKSWMAIQSAAEAAGTRIAVTDAGTALTVAPATELAVEYQGVLLWDAVVAAAREAGAGFVLASAHVADACGAQCDKTGFGLLDPDSFAEDVVSLIRSLAITGLELIGLMWRALAAALVGIFLASLARRRESQDLLATGGYSYHLR